MAGVVLVLDGMGPKPDARIERDGQNWEAQILTPEPVTLPGGVRRLLCQRSACWWCWKVWPLICAQH